MQADPEGFIRSLDADTGPDADNPRACGVALLLCMLRKGSSHVAEAMLSYVTHLQVCMRCSALCSALRLCLAFGFCLCLCLVVWLLPFALLPSSAFWHWSHYGYGPAGLWRKPGLPAKIWPHVACSTSGFPLAPQSWSACLCPV